MKYLMKRRWFEQKNDLSIFDEKRREVYRIDVNTLSQGNKMSFRDTRDHEMAFISRKLSTKGVAFEIYHGDDLQAIVRRDVFSPSRCKFSVEVSHPDDLSAEGDFTEHEYTFMREGKPVGRVSKGYFGNRDSYGVEVGRGEDELILLAGAAVIDLCCRADGEAARVAS